MMEILAPIILGILIIGAGLTGLVFVRHTRRATTPRASRSEDTIDVQAARREALRTKKALHLAEHDSWNQDWNRVLPPPQQPPGSNIVASLYPEGDKGDPIHFRTWGVPPVNALWAGKDSHGQDVWYTPYTFQRTSNPRTLVR